MAGVSYILTSYNKAAYLPCVLESIAREQELTPGEVIIVDDGSTDGSIDLCEQFAVTRQHVTFVKQGDAGVYAALNRAIPLAKGKWLRLCDCCSPLITRSTEYLIDMATMDNADVAYGRALPYGPGPLSESELDAVRPVSYAAVLEPDSLLHLIQLMGFSSARAIYRTARVRQAAPLPEDLISCPDFALTLRVAAGGRLVKLREPVCYGLAAAGAAGSPQALTCHQTIRILQASRRFLRRRHRNAAIAEFHKWARRKLRADLHGWRLQAQKAKLKALIAATRLGLCDWDNALDTFASFYEPELAPVFRNRVRIRQY